MRFNHLGELLVRSQPLPFETGFPTLKEAAGAAFSAVIPQLPEGLLEDVGRIQTPVGLEQFFSV